MSATSAKSSVLIVGCGDIGLRLADLLASDNFSVYGLCRNPSKLPAAVIPLAADYLNPAALASALAPHSFTFVIVTQTPQEFSEAGYRAAYLESTRSLLAVLQANSKPLPKRLFYVGSTSVYGQSNGEVVTETSPTKPTRFNGAVLVDVEALLRSSPVPTTILRAGGLCGDIVSLESLSLVRAARSGMGPEASPMLGAGFKAAQVHRQDVARAIAHLMARELDGAVVENCYNVTEKLTLGNGEKASWLLENMPGAPEGLVQWIGCDAKVIGKIVDSSRLRESGFEFMYPDFRAVCSCALTLAAV